MPNILSAKEYLDSYLGFRKKIPHQEPQPSSENATEEELNHVHHSKRQVENNREGKVITSPGILKRTSAYDFYCRIIFPK